MAKNQKALDGVASFYMLSVSYRGKDCALSLTGLYKTRDDAAIALSGLPASIREQHPRVVTVGEALRSAR